MLPKRDEPIWVKTFLTYNAPVDGHVDSWLVRMDKLKADGEWLLALESQRFTSLMLCPQSGAWSMINSYLKNCPRFYESAGVQDTFLSGNFAISKAQRALHRLILCALLRFSTSVPRLTDTDVTLICDVGVLYGLENENLVKTFVSNLINSNPAAQKQFIKMTNHLLYLIDECSTRVLQVFEQSEEHLQAQKCAAIINFLIDLSVTITKLAQFFPNAKDYLDQQSLTIKLPQFYDSVVRLLDEYLSNLHDCHDVRELKGQLNYGKQLLVSLFRTIVERVYLDQLDALKCDWQNWWAQSDILFSKLKFREDQDAAIQMLGNYFNLMRAVAEHCYFAKAYQSSFPLAEDLKTIGNQLHYGDIFKADLAFITNTLASMGISANYNCETERAGYFEHSVARIREFIGPEVEEDTIRECLGKFGGNEEQAMNALMDSEIDKDRPGPSRRAFENSQFVINRQEESENGPTYTPLRESKKRGLTAAGAINAKDREMLKNFYCNYVQTLEEEEDEKLKEQEYSDEYDDTYEN